MISDELTLQKFGYTASSLPPASGRPMITLCDHCGGQHETSNAKLFKSRKDIVVCSKIECRNWKAKQTFIRNYGVDNPNKSAVVRKKSELTCLARYGVITPFHSKKILEKAKQSHLIVHGVDNPFKLKQLQEKIQADNLIKYGYISPGSATEIKDKIKQTNMIRYGFEHSFQVESVKQKIKETMISRYGVDNANKSKEIRDKTEATCLRKYGVTTALKLASTRKALIDHNIKTYGVAYPVCKALKAQTEIETWLAGLGFNFVENNDLLAPKQIDLYNDDLKLGIEYCGLYWHNENSPEPRGCRYHYNKYKDSLDKGVRLITIFEDEWIHHKSQCKGFLQSVLNCDEKIGARKCKLVELEKQEAKTFIEVNHIQGSCSSGLVWFGLKYNDKLIGVLELGRHHRGKAGVVLTRLCFKSGTTVVGGASKLFKAAVAWCRTTKHSSITSWSDNRWSQGGVYKVLGFSLEANIKPDYSYYSVKLGNKRLSKQSQKKSATNCPKDKTESEWAKESGLSKIWDCGKQRWGYTIN